MHVEAFAHLLTIKVLSLDYNMLDFMDEYPRQFAHLNAYCILMAKLMHFVDNRFLALNCGISNMF